MRVTEPYTIFTRTLPSGKTVFYYQFRDAEGRRSHAKSTGCTTLSAARRFCQKLYNSNEFKSDSSITFEAFSSGFLDEDGDFRTWKKANGKDIKPETLRRYSLSLNTHLIPYFGKMEMKKITRSTCKKWVIWAGEQWSPKTVNNDQGVLNLIFEEAVEKEVIPKNPLHRLGLRRTEKKQRSLLTVEEIRLIYAAGWPNEQERKAFLLAAITGMRIGEVVALRKSDLKGGCADVSHDLSDRYGLQDATKTGLKRYVPIPKNYEFPETSSEWLFESGGNPLKTHCVYNAFSRRCDTLGIKRLDRGIDIHSLRDFFITYLRSHDVPDPKIRAVVGHADETMTDLYTHWKPEMLPEVYRLQETLCREITDEDNEDNKNV